MEKNMVPMSKIETLAFSQTLMAVATRDLVISLACGDGF